MDITTNRKTDSTFGHKSQEDNHQMIIEEELNRNDNEVPWSLCINLLNDIKLIKGYLQSHIALNHHFFFLKKNCF